MKIAVTGSGYVGIITGIGFAELNHNVVFIDIDEDKIDKINSCQPPIFEKDLEKLMEKNKKNFMQPKIIKSLRK